MSQQPPRNAMPKSGPDFASPNMKVNAVITGKTDPAGCGRAAATAPREESPKPRDSNPKKAKAPPVAPTKG